MKTKLLSFSVDNFRGFDSSINLSLDHPSDYQFQNDLVQDGVIKTAIIYGKNGSGKTSLCRALSDVVTVLTDLYASPNLVNSLNYGSSLKPIGEATKFVYRICAEGEVITFEYARNRVGLLCERLYSESKLVVSFENGKAFIDPEVAPKSGIDLASSFNGQFSFIKFLHRSGAQFQTQTIARMISFAESLLLVRSVINGPEFSGLQTSGSLLAAILRDTGSLAEFQGLLKENGIEYELSIEETADPNNPILYVTFPYEKRQFFEVASTGTSYLLLIFTWIKVIGNKACVFAIDEFDAYYHDDMARCVFSLLRALDCQVIVTTHRTCLMLNSIARPDCVFVLQNGGIKSLPELTDRELREANNIEKLYRNGAFEE